MLVKNEIFMKIPTGTPNLINSESITPAAPVALMEITAQHTPTPTGINLDGLPKNQADIINGDSSLSLSKDLGLATLNNSENLDLDESFIDETNSLNDLSTSSVVRNTIIDETPSEISSQSALSDLSTVQSIGKPTFNSTIQENPSPAVILDLKKINQQVVDNIDGLGSTVIESSTFVKETSLMSPDNNEKVGGPGTILIEKSNATSENHEQITNFSKDKKRTIEISEVKITDQKHSGLLKKLRSKIENKDELSVENEEVMQNEIRPGCSQEKEENCFGTAEDLSEISRHVNTDESSQQREEIKSKYYTKTMLGFAIFCYNF